MKIQIWPVLSLLLEFCLVKTSCSSQNIVEYNNACEGAYESYLQGNYSRAFSQFKDLDSIYVLRGDEIGCYFKCAVLSGEPREKAYEIYRRIFTSYFIDPSFLIEQNREIMTQIDFSWYIEKADEEIEKGELVEYQSPLRNVQEISNTLDSLEVRDQAVRDSFEIYIAMQDSAYAYNKMRMTDSSNFTVLLDIIREFGYPGNRLVPSNGKAWLILVHNEGFDNFEYLNSLLWSEVLKENLDAKSYAYWYDRNLYSQGKTPIYHVIQSMPRKESEVLENRKKIGLSRFYKMDM